MPTTSPSYRVQWIDFAKGVAIILIVLHHARDYELSLLLPYSGAGFYWADVEHLFYHIRLPTFFLLSGIAASGFLSRSRGGMNVGGAISSAYLYGIWSVILLIVAPEWPQAGADLNPDAANFPELFKGESVAWYLWATVVSFLVAYSTRWLPAMAVLVMTLAVASLSEYDGASDSITQALARCVPFYILGIRFPSVMIALAHWRSPIIFLVLLSGLFLFEHLDSGSYPISRISDSLGVCIALMAARWIEARYPQPARILAWLGRRTLPIYLIHFPIISLLGYASIQMLEPIDIFHPLAFTYTPALVLSTIGISLALHAILMRIGAGWLFRRPATQDFIKRLAQVRPHLPQK